MRCLRTNAQPAVSALPPSPFAIVGELSPSPAHLRIRTIYCGRGWDDLQDVLACQEFVDRFIWFTHRCPRITRVRREGQLRDNAL
jgi:hypothetical protein